MVYQYVTKQSIIPATLVHKLYSDMDDAMALDSFELLRSAYRSAMDHVNIEKADQAAIIQIRDEVLRETFLRSLVSNELKAQVLAATSQFRTVGEAETEAERIIAEAVTTRNADDSIRVDLHFHSQEEANAF